VRFVLCSGGVGTPLSPAGIDSAVQRTNHAWRNIAQRVAYDGPYLAEVRRSLLALKLLGATPGGVVVGPQTSWLRDASMTARALLELGFPDDATAFVRSALATAADTLVGAEAPAHLEELGEVIDAVAQAARRGAMVFDEEVRDLLLELGGAASRHWRGADLGLWETRGGRAMHTHSRVLCWVALDRMLDSRPARPAQRGARPLRRRARAHPARRREPRLLDDPVTYTSALDGDRVDASLMLLAWYGYVQPRAPRMRSTFQRLRERLTSGPALLLRSEDSLARREAAHGVASFWVAEHLARGGGPLAEAESWFKRLLKHANNAGLYGEMIDGESGEPSGGFPNAATHVALIGAALALEERRRKEISDEQPVVREGGGEG
jgi:GH15 family glucan-1,4-alpha-glucosidase